MFHYSAIVTIGFGDEVKMGIGNCYHINNKSTLILNDRWPEPLGLNLTVRDYELNKATYLVHSIFAKIWFDLKLFEG